MGCDRRVRGKDAGSVKSGGSWHFRGRSIVPPSAAQRHSLRCEMSSTLQVNGHRYEVHSPVGTTLAETLRDELTLTGTKVACGEGHCGACTVLVDGMPTLSCITLVHSVGDAKVTTIEGVRDHPMIDAFVRTDALQCGFCTPGQIMSAVELVDAHPP